MNFPDVNGISYDFSSVKISLIGDVTPAFKGIDYSQALEPGEARGNSSHWLRRTRGQLKAEASFEIHKVEWQGFIDQLGDGYMEKEFDILVSYADHGQPVISDEIVGARIKKHADSPKEGSEPPTVKVDLHILKVRPNGLEPTTDAIG